MSEGLHTVAITGGDGFLGRRLVELALPLFAEVRVVDLAPKPWAGLDTGRVRFFAADITQPGSLDAAFAGADTVIHAAAMVDTRSRFNAQMQAVNVDGTRLVVEACQRLGVRRLIHTSTMDVAFDGQPKLFATEGEAGYPAAPANGYIRTKMAAEQLALAASKPPALTVCSLRPTGIYGPEDRHRLGTMAQLIRSGELKMRFGDGTAQFDHVYVDNVAHAHMLAAQKMAAEPAALSGQAYFIGDHKTGNFFEFLAPFFAAAGLQLPSASMPKGVAMVLATVTEWLTALLGPIWPRFNPQLSRYVVRTLAQDWTFSYAKATRDFGYTPLVPLDEARARTAEWARTANL